MHSDARLSEPPLVTRALALERSLGFERSSIPEVGRLLQVLAAQRGRRVLVGDWHELMPPEAPFDLLFLDSGKQHPEVDGEDVMGLLAPGATILMDDLTPSFDDGRAGKAHTASISAERAPPRGPDPVREFWLNHPELAAIEILTTPETAAILGTRLV